MHKRLVMVSVAALGLAAANGSATAQVPLLPVPKASFGIIGGLNVSTFGGSGTTGFDINSRTGFQGGVFVTLHLTNSFGIEPELLYSQQGANQNDGQGTESSENLDYIQLPILFRLDLPSASAPIHPFIIAGPQASYQVKCTLGAATNGATATVDCDKAAADLGVFLKKKSFDYGAVGGVGVALGMGGKSLSISARYTYGFNDTFEGSSIKNRYFSILAGLSF